MVKCILKMMASSVHVKSASVVGMELFCFFCMELFYANGLKMTLSAKSVKLFSSTTASQVLTHVQI